MRSVNVNGCVLRVVNPSVNGYQQRIYLFHSNVIHVPLVISVQVEKREESQLHARMELLHPPTKLLHAKAAHSVAHLVTRILGDVQQMHKQDVESMEIVGQQDRRGHYPMDALYVIQNEILLHGVPLVWVVSVVPLPPLVSFLLNVMLMANVNQVPLLPSVQVHMKHVIIHVDAKSSNNNLIHVSLNGM